MTWLGKILSVFALILSVAAMWFITTVYVARTNWKNDRDAWQALYKEADKARTAELSRYQSERESLKRQLEAERTHSQGLLAQLATVTGANDKISEANKKLNEVLSNADIKAVELQAINDALAKESRENRLRNKTLEDERVVLTTARENALKEKQEFENKFKQADTDNKRLEARVESLVGQVADLRASGGSSTATVQNSFVKRPAPLPDNIRGRVTAYKNGYVELNIGIDAGLTNGAKLDVYRTEGKGDYLGTVTVERVYPKNAVAKFVDKQNRAVSRLRPEELPKVGDSVGIIGGSQAINR